MSQAIEGRLLLDRITVQGAALSICMALLADGPMKAEELSEAISPGTPGAGMGELLPFLVESGLARASGEELGLLVAAHAEADQRLVLLRLLHGRLDQNRLFRRVWEELLEEDGSSMIQRDQIWPQVQRRIGEELPRLNSNRMAQWMRLASYIGLIQPERSNQFLLVPTERWLLSLLNVTLPKAKEMAMAEWVTLVEERYCRITRRPGQLHPSIASVVSLFADDGTLSLSYLSDERAVRVGDRLVSLIGWGAER
jgi:hypothetical protein